MDILRYIERGILIKFALIGTLVFTHFFALAQEKIQAKPGKTYKSFSYKKWISLKKSISYNEEKPEKSKRAQEEEDKDREKQFRLPTPIQINGAPIKVLLFVLAAGALIFILLKLFNQPFDKDLEISENKYSIDNLEERVHEANLESFLQKAKSDGNYKLVVRIYYLIIIRELSNKKFIFWKKEKTNAEYLREMRERESYETFRELTFLFEWVWFGNKGISERQYQKLSANFEEFIDQLKGK
jgi:hypothetical protein